MNIFQKGFMVTTLATAVVFGASPAALAIETVDSNKPKIADSFFNDYLSWNGTYDAYYDQHMPADAKIDFVGVFDSAGNLVSDEFTTNPNGQVGENVMAGHIARYRITFTNTSDETYTNITVSSQIDRVSRAKWADSIAPGETITREFNWTLSEYEIYYRNINSVFINYRDDHYVENSKRLTIHNGNFKYHVATDAKAMRDTRFTTQYYFDQNSGKYYYVFNDEDGLKQRFEADNMLMTRDNPEFVQNDKPVGRPYPLKYFTGGDKVYGNFRIVNNENNNTYRTDWSNIQIHIPPGVKAADLTLTNCKGDGTFSSIKFGESLECEYSYTMTQEDFDWWNMNLTRLTFSFINEGGIMSEVRNGGDWSPHNDDGARDYSDFESGNYSNYHNAYNDIAILADKTEVKVGDQVNVDYRLSNGTNLSISEWVVVSKMFGVITNNEEIAPRNYTGSPSEYTYNTGNKINVVNSTSPSFTEIAAFISYGKHMTSETSMSRSIEQNFTTTSLVPPVERGGLPAPPVEAPAPPTDPVPPVERGGLPAPPVEAPAPPTDPVPPAEPPVPPTRVDTGDVSESQNLSMLLLLLGSGMTTVLVAFRDRLKRK